MTKISRRTAIIGGASALAVPILPTLATAGVEHFADEGLGQTYLAWLHQEKLNIAHALGAVDARGFVTHHVVPGLDEAMAMNGWSLDKRARLHLSLDLAEDLRAWA